MKSSSFRVVILVVCLFLLLGPAAWAQMPAPVSQSVAPAPPPAATAEVPRLIKFSGTLLDAKERPMIGPIGITFALYSQQSGGAALWLETQNVQPDANGNYTVLLGANTASGVPAELFVSGEARWLGIQVGQQPEHERILLVSVPYALKAGDAETLGGLPASAFVTTATAGNAGNSAGGAAVSSSAAPTPAHTQSGTAKGTSAPQPAAACTGVTSNGSAMVNSIALFTTACNVQGSLMSQATINGFPGINLAGNNAGLLLNGTGTHQVQVTGATSGRLGQDANGFFFASDTKNASVRFLTNNGVLNEWMRITSAGNIGIGTQTPAAKLDVSGSLNFKGNTLGAAIGDVGCGGGETGHGSAGFQVSGVLDCTHYNLLGDDTNTFINRPSTGKLHFREGNSDQMVIASGGNVGIGTSTPSNLLSFGGQSAASFGMDPNPTAGAAGNTLTIIGGSAATGATDQPGGDLILSAGNGTGLGASGNARIQTAGSAGASGTTGDTLIDREIIVAKAKPMTLAVPGFTSLLSINLAGTNTAAGRVRYMIRATDGGSQIATESGVLLYVATANSITCSIETGSKLSLGTVNSGCTPGFFNPGSQPGVSIFDNVSFSTPASIVVHEVYFTIENESGSAIRLEP